MARPAKDGPKQQIRHLGEKRRRLMQLLYLGKSHKEIGAEIGLSPARISVIRNSPVFVDPSVPIIVRHLPANQLE